MRDRPRHVAFVFLRPAQAGGEALWRPPVDVYRTRTGWLLKFELPGVRAEDVDVQTRGSSLYVRGMRRDCVLEDICSVYSMEITYNRFERAIELPCDLDNARLTLEFRDGNLLVRVSLEGRRK